MEEIRLGCEPTYKELKLYFLSLLPPLKFQLRAYL